MQDGPLDMRMDQAQALTAADIVNRYSQAELSGLLWHLGEEREARRISQRIIAAREKQAIETTCQLAALIETAKGGRRGKRQHPATKSFQALRMAVNGELEGIDRGLHEGLQLLKDGGRMAVISFHSLEDRRVKHFFRDHEGCWVAQQSGGEQWQGVLPAVKRLTRKAVKPSATECAENVRARSSRLRVAERLASPHQDRS